MQVSFVRTGERRYGVYVERDGFPPVEMNPAPGYDPHLPHDFVHFVVEQELGIERGIFGQLATGGDAGTFRLGAPTRSGRDGPRVRRRNRLRAAKLAREGKAQAELSERAATICHHAWLARSSRAELRAEAREIAPYVARVKSKCSPKELALLSDDAMDRICERLDRMRARWARVGVGQSVTLRWSLTQKRRRQRSIGPEDVVAH